VILGNLLLALAWAALNGEFTLGNLFIGAALGRAVLMLLGKGGVLPLGELARFERALVLLGYLLGQIVLANLRIALDVLSTRHRMRPGVIRIPLDVTADIEILLLATMINITPGSVALDVSADRKVMYVHVMHIRTPDAAREHIKHGFERRIIELRGRKEKELYES
jgi:multicomponent Na+:H+ antiporter subunit E